MMSERVYTCVDFFDRPLSGAADFEGRPHWYRCEFDAAIDDYRQAYGLVPLPKGILAAALEQQEIYLAWHEVYRCGRTPRDTHPALPESRARYEELKQEIQSFLKSAVIEAEATADWRWEQGDYRVTWRRV